LSLSSFFPAVAVASGILLIGKCLLFFLMLNEAIGKMASTAAVKRANFIPSNARNQTRKEFDKMYNVIRPLYKKHTL